MTEETSCFFLYKLVGMSLNPAKGSASLSGEAERKLSARFLSMEKQIDVFMPDAICSYI